MTLKALVPICALALASLGIAQIPIPEHDSPSCGGVRESHPSWSTPPLVPRFQGRLPLPEPATDLCAQYTKAGWDRTMELRLGEGAEEYRSLIELAVKTWNEALLGFNQKPVIEISRLRPRNYSLGDDFWQQYNADYRLSEGVDLREDGQSVIYFKGNDPENRYSGIAWSRWNDKSMEESDIYINLTSAEKYAPFRVKVRALMTHDGRTIYVPALSIYVTILHEIGHALGLNHVPVSGNIMSYNYMPHMVEKWKGVLISEFLAKGESVFRRGLFSYFTDSDPDYRGNWYYEDPGEDRIGIAELFTSTAGLGEQDRMTLLCAYDFSEWNH